MIKVKLFWDWIGENADHIEWAIARMEKEMNDFLETKKEENIKKIYIALGEGQRMGLVEYRE